ncbi:beta-ketoacyl-[acyl-carrier-protein] synthase family protein [Burkholderia territorii]|uniref:beta-ketoacyl-[acyl-carrier-protein] synthase family protein n=1 Tax=Burkholderia territorii TaxID=1503055 RepID=UPI000A628476|nr:beta-ketoacyl synthase N-terminal-like domain-containing protein [Burkholderia territorii]
MHNTYPRIVISGAGCIGPLGLDAVTTWRSMVEGKDGIRPVDWPDDAGVELNTSIVAAVQDFDPAARFDSKLLRKLDRVSQFALTAANEAITAARVNFVEYPALASRTAVVVGGANGGEIARDRGARNLYRDGKAQIDALTVLRVMPNAPAAHISIQHRITGPSFTVSSACSSANHAIAQAVHLLRAGVADVAIAGGADASLSPSFVKAWEAMRILSNDTCRPFSSNRSGLVLGEGAAMFVLERLDHAVRRNAPILCELAGVGMSSDASDLIAPNAEGPATALVRGSRTRAGRRRTWIM